MAKIEKNFLSIFDTENQAESGAVLHLKHPATGELMYVDDKEEKPLTINLKGANSTTFERELEKRGRLNKNKKLSSEEVKLQTCEIYAKLTTGWSGFSEDFSFESAVDMYLTYKDIREQVGNFIGNKANFIES